MDALSQRGIPAHIAGVTSSVDSLYQENSVVISGIYRAKGNEAAMVYIAHSEYVASPYIPVRARNVMFTAMTRSRAWVRLCGIGEAMRDFTEELQRVKEHGYRLAFKVPTVEELQKMQRIHRDKTDTEIAKQRDLLQSLDQVLVMAESGDLVREAIPDELKKRLGSFLGLTDDAE